MTILRRAHVHNYKYVYKVFSQVSMNDFVNWKQHMAMHGTVDNLDWNKRCTYVHRCIKVTKNSIAFLQSAIYSMYVHTYIYSVVTDTPNPLCTYVCRCANTCYIAYINIRICSYVCTKHTTYMLCVTYTLKVVQLHPIPLQALLSCLKSL